MSAHENEYHDNMVAMLELVWGEGYMAPGGRENVARLLDGAAAGPVRHRQLPHDPLHELAEGGGGARRRCSAPGPRGS